MSIAEYEYNKIEASNAGNNANQESAVVELAPELKVPLSDKDFYIMVTKRINASQGFWNKVKLGAIRNKNVNYWLGKQLDDVALYDWQTPYIQNIIFRNVETIISNSLGRTPNPIVIPASETIQSRTNALTLQKKLKRSIERPRTRRKLRQALRHLLLMRLGTIKYVWNETLCNGKGDYEKVNVHPDDILIDHTSYFDTNPKMVVHYLEESIKQIIAKFPSKKEELFKRFDIKQGTENQLATTLRYEEIWFTWHDDKGRPVEGIGWKYDNIVLGIMKNPYYDYKGYSKEEDKGEVDPETGASTKPTYYKNYFETPKKPFIFFNYLNLGKTLIDDTTLTEQSLLLQDNINKRGRQITQQADTANGKWVFSADAISKAEAEKVTDSPNEHILLKSGRVSDGAARIAGQGPNQTLFAAQGTDIDAVDNLFGTHGPMRGEKTGGTATGDVLSKEGDTTRIDDLVAESVEIGVNDMVEWETHLIKLFYTEEHYVKDLGKDGKLLSKTLSSDLVEDGLEIDVKASTADKDAIRADAIELAGMALIDPLTLMEDLDKDNPKERARRIMLYANDPMRYMEEVLELDTGDAGRVKKAIDMLKEGEMPELPKSVTEEYLAGLADYLETPEFKELDKEIQTSFFEFIQQVKEIVINGGGQGDQTDQMDQSANDGNAPAI